MDEFSRLGYAVVPSILNPDEVTVLRDICAKLLLGGGTQEMTASEFLSVREIAEVPFRGTVVSTLKELLGDDYRVYPNLKVRKDLYVPWHVDNAFTGPGAEYVWKPGFGHVQAAVYLQDNDPLTGGGLDVLPGSHLTSFDAYGTGKPDFGTATTVINEAGLGTTVEAKAGDLVLWHGRLLHASTPVSGPATDAKFGIFFSSGRNSLYANNRYLAHLMVKRVREGGDVARIDPQFAEIADFRYPQSYPEWLVALQQQHGIAMATF